MRRRRHKLRAASKNFRRGRGKRIRKYGSSRGGIRL